VRCLVNHDCQDVTGSLDPDSSSHYPVARGGFGNVYLARLRDGTPVAVKCLAGLANMGLTNESQKTLKVRDSIRSFHVVIVDTHILRHISALHASFTPGPSVTIPAFYGCLEWLGFGDR
jgi:hypothetical protein